MSVSFLDRLKQRQAESGEMDLKQIAEIAGYLVYLGGLAYAGVRSFSLFQRTIAPEFFPFAVLGVITAEISAIGLPLYIHFVTAPGRHRNAAFAFYGLDLLLVVFNTILDAAHQQGSVMPWFMDNYAVYGLPAMPIMCMVGWAIMWMMDPRTKRRDAIASIRTAMDEVLTEQIGEAMTMVEITDDVRQEAQDRARALTQEMLQSNRPLPKTLNAQRQSLGYPPVASFAETVPAPPHIEVVNTKNPTGGTTS